jgi:hypothetical protein
MKAGYLQLGENCLGYQNLSVGTTQQKMSVPKGALSAEVILIANNATDINSIACYFREDGQNATNIEGLPLLHLTPYTIRRKNLDKFSIISADGNTHSLRIQYFGA